jgi:hypothetical protein
MLAVVVSDVEIDGEYQFERRQFGSNPAQLRQLAAGARGRGSGHGIDGAVLETSLGNPGTVLEAHLSETGGDPSPVWKLHLAQAQSNRAPRGRKKDYADGQRWVK